MLIYLKCKIIYHLIYQNVTLLLKSKIEINKGSGKVQLKKKHLSLCGTFPANKCLPKSESKNLCTYECCTIAVMVVVNTTSFWHHKQYLIRGSLFYSNIHHTSICKCFSPKYKLHTEGISHCNLIVTIFYSWTMTLMLSLRRLCFLHQMIFKRFNNSIMQHEAILI